MVRPRADILRLSPEPLAALVKRPGEFIHQLWMRLTRRVAAEFDPGEAAAYKEAAREAFRTTGDLLDAPRALGPGSTAETARLAASAEGPIESAGGLPAYARKPGPIHSDELGASSRSEMVEPGAITVEDGVSDAPSPGRARNQAGASAPDHLLRKAANATRVADDFFDGLVRRVEGDR